MRTFDPNRPRKSNLYAQPPAVEIPEDNRKAIEVVRECEREQSKSADFKKLLDKPVLAIAVGIGLIALGAALKSAAKQQFKGFALGGRNIAGGVALVGERGPELVNLPKGSDVIPNSNFNNIQAGAMEVYGRIVAQGTELAVIIDRARATNRRNN